jgi:hypothetical protein
LIFERPFGVVNRLEQPGQLEALVIDIHYDPESDTFCAELPEIALAGPSSPGWARAAVGCLRRAFDAGHELGLGGRGARVRIDFPAAMSKAEAESLLKRRSKS